MRRVTILLAAAALGASGCSLDDKDGKDGKDPPLDGGGIIVIDAVAPIDAPIDASTFCTTCGPGEICVQFFNGTCGTFNLGCQARNDACTGNTCSQDCMRWHCNAGNEDFFFRCDVGGCGGEVPGALHCYGP